MKVITTAVSSFHRRKSTALLHSTTTTITTTAPSPSPPPSPHPLHPTQQTQIHHLIPHLCYGNNTPTAIDLLTTCLLHTSTPPHSLPFPVLISHLTSSASSLSHSISLLSSAPRRHSLHLSTLLLSSFFKNHRPRDAMEVYRWVCKEGKGSARAMEVGKLVVVGLCRCGEMREAVGVVRDLVDGGGKTWVDVEVRKWVYWGLIREARVKEAVVVGKALVVGVSGGGACGGEDFECVELLDRIIEEWKD